MMIVGVLMIAGGLSAHGYEGYRGECGRERVVVRPYYAPCEAIRRAPVYYGEVYGYRPVVVYRHDCDRGYYGSYRGCRR